MAGIIRYVSLFAVRTMAQRQPKKSAGYADSGDSSGNPDRKRRFDTQLSAEVRHSGGGAAEEALRRTVEHAGLADRQTILEFGCGWGSLSLWMTRQFPHARVMVVSNSQAQRNHVEDEGWLRGRPNLRAVTADMNVFSPEGQFDRIVSVGTSGQMTNWRKLMTRIRSWLAPSRRPCAGSMARTALWMRCWRWFLLATSGLATPGEPNGESAIAG
ncbi:MULTISPECIES: SAM-dependent methyltransferase [Bradyrhizobium]|uniref:SAM-dependent methyltransferase n=1 Tax=Bradyrhizobium TaxID=374 RepID=UPI0004B35A63|nr:MULTISPECIES: methyltransferase domain-containing protein [unclassified Bradyrhizobium]MDA9425237.1 hypothetical protein [Bradyrhizobium sp. CCBAU 53380]